MTSTTPVPSTPPADSLAERARSARMALHDLRDQRAHESEQVAIETAGRIVEDLLRQFTDLATCEAALRDLDVGVVAPKLPADLSTARSHLRRLATDMENPKTSLSDRLKNPSQTRAIQTVKSVIQARKQALHAAVEQERTRLRPTGLTQDLVGIPGRERLSVAVTSIRRTFDERIAAKNVDALPSYVESLRANATRWTGIAAELEEFIQTLQPEIRDFLTAANAQGANWELVTPRVRDWLDDGNHGDGFKVVKC